MPTVDASAMRRLPVELTCFVGRGRELGEVKALVAAYRLVTVTGMGGVGKTRLALRPLQVDGPPDKAIAEALSLSRRTVESHVEHTLAKLGFTSRTQVAAWVAGRRPSGGPG